MKFGILQQPIGTLQIPSRDLQRVFKFAKLMRKIPNELRSQKRNAPRSLPVIYAFNEILLKEYYTTLGGLSQKNWC
jgi:hypothetical protein